MSLLWERIDAATLHADARTGRPGGEGFIVSEDWLGRPAKLHRARHGRPHGPPVHVGTVEECQAAAARTLVLRLCEITKQASRPGEGRDRRTGGHRQKKARPPRVLRCMLGKTPTPNSKNN